MEYRYTAAGLNVVSEISLPGLMAAPAQTGDPDVSICLDDVPDALGDTAVVRPNWQLAADRCLVRVPNVARFAVSAGREIRVAPEGGTPLPEIAIFVTGTMLAILLHQRAQVVLHASAVLVGGKAVLFCGASGAGKSTMAAALNQRGYAVISDDVSAIRLRDGEAPQVLPDGRNLKLWRQAADRLGLQRGMAVRRQIEKYYVEPGSVLSEAVPVGAVYELVEARAAMTPGIAQPNVVDAALIVRRNAYRPMLVKRMGQQNRYFEGAARLAGSAGIFSLTRARDFAQMDTVIGWLEAHWAARGLMSGAA